MVPFQFAKLSKYRFSLICVSAVPALNKIEQLKKVPEIARIVVSSDSDMMLEMARSAGALTHKRTPEYCDEKTKSFGEVVRHVAESVEGEHILWATCTSPLDGILLAPRKKMIEWSYFHGKNPLRFIIDKRTAVDIDDGLDFAVARAWLDMDESVSQIVPYSVDEEY